MERSGSFCAGVVTCILILVLAHGTQAQYGGGSGTAQDPYRIATAADLIALGRTSNDYDKHFVLTADIDLDPNLPGGKVFDKAVIAPLSGVNSSGVPWNPTFTGVFDGNRHVISHLSIRSENFLGLFGGLGSTGRIVNLALDGVNIKGTGAFAGGLVGYSFGVIANCRITGTVGGGDDVGGLVGYSRYGGDIVSCQSAAAVSGRNEVGGLAGSNSGYLYNSCSSGTVSGSVRVGGLAGESDESMISCCSTATVRGDRQVGGLVGSNGYRIVNCYSAGVVTGDSDVGGLVGYCPSAAVLSCFWDNQTTGQTRGVHGTGRTTAQMRDTATFLNAGWDLAGESLNGTSDIWRMSPGQYPTPRSPVEERPPMPEGSGTAEDPYRIHDACDLGTMWLDPDAHYRLENSVDLTGITWSTAVVPWFGGSFDGNGHAIRNLHIRGYHDLGLAGELASEGSISDLGLEEVDVNGLGSHVGSFAAVNRGTITNGYSTGVVRGASTTGGLVGANGGSMADSYNACNVMGAGDAGGIAAHNSGSITNCSNRGAVAGGEWTGGLASNNYKGNVVDCYNTGAVSGKDRVGGLLGANSGSVASSYSAGKVTGAKYVGGLVGYNYASILNSYSTGKVVGIDMVGGFVGISSGHIANCYSAGRVDANWTPGGLLGSNKGQVLASFWDIGTSCQEISEGGTGMTTGEMKKADAFVGAGWDFVGETANGVKDLWWILDGKDYPRLWWELEK